MTVSSSTSSSEAPRGDTVLSVRDLVVQFKTEDGYVPQSMV